MPRWAGVFGATGTAGAAISAGVGLSIELLSLTGWLAVDTEAGRKICTTTKLITRCTGQNRLMNHSSTK
jgi:hypothetical protein